jgi:hypothetical protein
MESKDRHHLSEFGESGAHTVTVHGSGFLPCPPQSRQILRLDEFFATDDVFGIERSRYRGGAELVM